MNWNETLGNAGLVELPLVVAEAVAVGQLLRLLVEHNIVLLHFVPSYYVATDFDRNMQLLGEKLRFVDWGC